MKGRFSPGLLPLLASACVPATSLPSAAALAAAAPCDFRCDDAGACASASHLTAVSQVQCALDGSGTRADCAFVATVMDDTGQMKPVRRGLAGTYRRESGDHWCALPGATDRKL